MIYTCMTKCYWRRRIWEIGDTIESDGGEDIPRHFNAERQEQTKTTDETDIVIPVAPVTEDQSAEVQPAQRRGRGRPRKG